jgi:hypothetical protein
VIPIDDILYELPEKPAKSEILFSKLPKKQQKWKRESFPHDFGNWTEEEQINYVRTDVERRINGVWMMINGEEIYITGHHYFYLQWWYIGADTNDGYPEYRYADLFDFYFIDYCEKDPNCYGDIYLTNKRSGKTEKRLAIVYNRTSLVENAHAGLQSISGNDAKENLFINRIVRSFKMIPYELRPVYDGNDDPKKVLRFFAPSQRSSKKKSYAKALNSYIDYEETSETAYQGRRMHTLMLDEPGTISAMDVSAWWQTHKKQTVIGPKIYGKTFLATTLENMKERGGKQYMNLWQQSDPNKKDANGRTVSGLYRHFRPAYIGMEGFIDEYGKDQMTPEGEYKAKIFLQNERDGADPATLAQLKRQFPFTVEEAFDIVQADVWEGDVKEILKTCRNNLHKQDLPIKKVRLYELSNEVLYTAKKDDPYSVQIFEDPMPDVKYYAGFDGAGSDQTVGGEHGSKVAMVVVKGFGGMHGASYAPVAIFAVRPERMEEAYQVVLLLSKYYNKYGKLKLLGETNAGQGAAVLSYFMNRGCGSILMDRPKNIGVNFEDKSSKKWIYRGVEVKQLQIVLANRYLRRYADNIPFLDLIESLVNLGKQNEDYADAFLMALLAMGDFEQKENKQRMSVSPKRWVFKGLRRDSSGRTTEHWEQI